MKLKWRKLEEAALVITNKEGFWCWYIMLYSVPRTIQLYCFKWNTAVFSRKCLKVATVHLLALNSHSSNISCYHGSHYHVFMNYHLRLLPLVKPRCTNQGKRLLLWKHSSHQLLRDRCVSWRPNDMSKCKAPCSSLSQSGVPFVHGKKTICSAGAFSSKGAASRF